MADVVSPEVRSRMMSGIRGKNTKPEMVIRRGLHARGYRYLLHDGRLPGKPDLVFPKHRAVIFVHGCFWHGHDCHLFKWPKSRWGFWRKKIERNREIGECALKGRTRLAEDQVMRSIGRWLDRGKNGTVIRGTYVA